MSISNARRSLVATGLLLILAGGCGDDESVVTNNGTTTGTQQPPPKIVGIGVDANRNGNIDEGDGVAAPVWDDTTGASFLANLDDDDQDGRRDADDDVINGGADISDLAPIQVRPWPDAPEGHSGSLSIDDAAAAHVRIWKQLPDGSWSLVLGSLGPCNEVDPTCSTVTSVQLTIDEVRSGLNLGIEGRGFRISLADGEWTGLVDLAYSVLDDKAAPVTTDDVPDGVARAQMRVAPWIMVGNLTPTIDTVYANSVSSVFVSGITTATTAGQVDFHKITDWSGDQWTQDYFQTAWTSIPGPDGTVRGMRIANPRPWGRTQSDSALPIKWLYKSYLGPDRGVVQIYKTPHTGDSYDSHGNHEMLPPYENGAETFPVGRIFHGSGILKETKAFYAAQLVQGPPLVVDTSWLIVGHTDEVFSSVRANTPRGWKLLIGSPRLARKMLEDAQAAGHGAVEMFVGRVKYDNSPAAISIDEVLADPDLMAWGQQAQAEIDSMHDVVQAAVGLADDEFIEIPYLFEKDSFGMVAYNPGTANLLAFGDIAAIPDPFGPKIDGVDIFRKDLEDRLGTPANQLGSDGQGYKITFVNDWDWYHILLGEVHCGSNIDAAPPVELKWWEVAR